MACERLQPGGLPRREPEIASITGHESLREVERYAHAANRAKLAETATAKVVAAFPGRNKNTVCENIRKCFTFSAYLFDFYKYF